MEFEWDPAKSLRNLASRGLPFDLVAELFDGPIIEQVDFRRNYGEVRMQAIGKVGNRVLLCIYTDRGVTRRIISLRYANRRERNAYGAKARS